MSNLNPTLGRVRFEEVTPANEYAAFFDASIESLVAHLDVPIFEGYDDLDDMRLTFITLPSGTTVTLGQYPHSPEPGTYLCVVAIDRETSKLVAECCQQLKISNEEILWVHPDFQDEFDRLYAAVGNFPREHQTPQIEEFVCDRRYEPIDCFHCSLLIYPQPKFPEYWAMLQHNLGLAYYHRTSGDRRENLEKSIECFNNSMQVYTQSNFPSKWEINQQDLSAARRSLALFTFGSVNVPSKMVRLIYNEKTKKLEPKQVNWIHLLSPLTPYMDLWEGVKYIVDRFSSPGSLSQNDTENLTKILAEGRKQKFDEMEIEMSRDTAIGLKIDDMEGANITIGSEGTTTYVMKVKWS